MLFIWWLILLITLLFLCFNEVIHLFVFLIAQAIFFYCIKRYIASLNNCFNWRASPSPVTVTNNHFVLSQFLIVSVSYLLVFVCMDLHLCIWFHFHNHNQGQNFNDPLANTLSNETAVRFTKFCLRFIMTLWSFC